MRRGQTLSHTAARGGASSTAAPVGSSDDADPLLSSSDARWLRAECLRVFQRLFLDGFDGAFLRYELIDAEDGPAAEWVTVEEEQEGSGTVGNEGGTTMKAAASLADGSSERQRAQEAYFDAPDGDALDSV